MEVAVHSLAREKLLVRLQVRVVGRMFGGRSLVVVGNVAVLAVGSVAVAAAAVEEIDNVAGLEEVWVAVVGVDRSLLEVVCLVVEEEGSSCVWFELEEGMMEVEQSAAVAGECRFQRQEEEGSSSTF